MILSSEAWEEQRGSASAIQQRLQMDWSMMELEKKSHLLPRGEAWLCFGNLMSLGTELKANSLKPSGGGGGRTIIWPWVLFPQPDGAAKNPTTSDQPPSSGYPKCHRSVWQGKQGVLLLPLLELL